MSKLVVLRSLSDRVRSRSALVAATVLGTVVASPLALAGTGGLGVGLGSAVTSAAGSFKTTMITVIGGLIAGIIIVALGILGFRWAVSLSKGR
ncbi:MAG: hypothetical protein JJ714_03205 [Acidithiobacillus sp.]|nr:hypothetical protein [Acidithiobacillus sp.]